jgi:tetrahydromethanopterin S-methyltransferase subunit G
MDFQQELKAMDERLTDLEGKIDKIDGKINQVIDALVGNPLIGKENGLVSKIEFLEKEIDELRDFKKKIIYTVSAIVGMGLVIEFIIKTYLGIQK